MSAIDGMADFGVKEGATSVVAIWKMYLNSLSCEKYRLTRRLNALGCKAIPPTQNGTSIGEPTHSGNRNLKRNRKVHESSYGVATHRGHRESVLETGEFALG